MTRDDTSTSSNPSETSDSSDHEWEDHANINVKFGEQEKNYCQDDTVQQLKAVDKSTLVLHRNTPQPPKPVSCSDVNEETCYEPPGPAKLDNQGTQFSGSLQPSVVNSSQTLKPNVIDASLLPRQQKPSGKTNISANGVVTNHQNHENTSESDTDEDDHPLRTGSNGEQSNSMDFEDNVQEDHQPDPFATIFIVLPDPPGFIAILYLYNINVTESHERH